MPIRTRRRGRSHDEGQGILLVLVGVAVSFLMALLYSQKITNLEDLVLSRAKYRDLEDYIENRIDLVSTIGGMAGYSGLNKSPGDYVYLCPKTDPTTVDTSSDAGYDATNGDFRCATTSLQMVRADSGGTTLSVKGKDYRVRAKYHGKLTTGAITAYTFDIEVRTSPSSWKLAFTTTLPKGPCATPVAGVPCASP